MTPAIPMADKFWRSVGPDETGGDCWVWAGFLDSKGYGKLSSRGKTLFAHRVSYELIVAEIPDGLQIDHLCRNKSCVNPWHLEPVTGSVNTLRAVEARIPPTHCRHGHEYTDETLLIRPTPTGSTRKCRICVRQHDRDKHERRRKRAASRIAPEVTG